jgi:MoaA/NifB/PqqE/SkfB family radical SAM enzyme
MGKYPHHRYVGKYLLRNRLNSVHIEPTDVCNANCIMCSYGSMTRTKGMMKRETFEKTIREYRELNVGKIYLNFFGEPLLHRDIIEFSRFAVEESGAHVTFDTNGLLLDGESAENLLKLGMDITISLHGLTKQHYKAIYGVDAFDRVLTNVRNAIKTRNRLGLGNVVYIQTTKMDITYHDDEEIQRRLDELFSGEAAYSITSCSTIAGNSREDHRISKVAHRRVSPCRWLLDHLAVLWNGDVTVCCADSNGVLKLGNIGDSSLAELWGGQLHRRYQMLHMLGRYGDMPLCSGCDDGENG